MDQNDTADSAEDESVNVDELREKICKLEEEKQRYEQIQDQMNATGQREVSLVDPDSRLMRVDSQRLEVCYNIQTSVDAKQHLIVDYDVINNSTDHHQLTTDAKAAKQMLGVDRLEALSDKGFYVANDLTECEEAGITVFMPIPAFNPTESVGVPEPEFGYERFVYNTGTKFQVGSSTTAAARTQYAIQAAFSTAPESSQFSTGAGSYAAGGGVMSCAGAIAAGGSGTINEVASFGYWPYSSSNMCTVMLTREVLGSGVSFSSGNAIVCTLSINI